MDDDIMAYHTVVIMGTLCAVPESFAYVPSKGEWYDYAVNACYSAIQMIRMYQIRDKAHAV